MQASVKLVCNIDIGCIAWAEVCDIDCVFDPVTYIYDCHVDLFGYIQVYDRICGYVCAVCEICFVF